MLSFLKSQSRFILGTFIYIYFILILFSLIHFIFFNKPPPFHIILSVFFFINDYAQLFLL